MDYVHPWGGTAAPYPSGLKNSYHVLVELIQIRLGGLSRSESILPFNLLAIVKQQPRPGEVERADDPSAIFRTALFAHDVLRVCEVEVKK